MLTKKPIWFLDIDGVVNVLKWKTTSNKKPAYLNLWETWEETTILGYPILFSPELIKELNELSHHVQFKWLTTWKHDAPKHFAPQVGLNNFEVAVADGSEYPNAHLFQGEYWWKMNAVINSLNTEGAPVIWSDDDINRKTTGLFVKKHAESMGVPLKTFAPFSGQGLAPHHIENAYSFLEENS